MRQRPVLPLIVTLIAVVALASCGPSGSESEGKPPTAIPIEQLVTSTPTRMSEQIMIVPTPEPGPAEQIMATPIQTPVVRPSPTPEPTPPGPAPATTTEAAEPPAATTPDEGQVPGAITHVVQPGENLYGIGLIYGIGWEEIATANNLQSSDHIEVGQILTIPVGGAVADEPGGTTSHIVQSGETLYLISLQYNVPWETIAQANSIADPNSIYVGQELIIP